MFYAKKNRKKYEWQHNYASYNHIGIKYKSDVFKNASYTENDKRIYK